MDTLDIRILRRLFQGGAYSPHGSALRESLAMIAKGLGVDEDTVRNRLRKFQESGFIPKWRLYVNPRVWGGGQIAVWTETNAGAARLELVERLRNVPGVIIVYICYRGLLVFHEYEEEWSLPRTIERIRTEVGAPDVFVARVAFPERDVDLGDRDWDLIRAMHGNPWRPNAELAAEVGLSGRATRARLSRIFAQGVLFAWPSLDLRAIQGGILTHLLAWYAGVRKTEVDEAVAACLEPYLWHVIHMRPYQRGDLTPCCYNLMFPNVPAAQEALSRVRELPGVERAAVHLHEDIYNFFEAYDARLEARLSRAPGTRSFAATGGGPDRLMYCETA